MPDDVTTSGARCKPPCASRIAPLPARPGSWRHEESGDDFFCPHAAPEPTTEADVFLTAEEVIAALHAVSGDTRVLVYGGISAKVRDARILPATGGGVVIICPAGA
jgi:hypothetical protein